MPREAGRPSGWVFHLLEGRARVSGGVHSPAVARAHFSPQLRSPPQSWPFCSLFGVLEGCRRQVWPPPPSPPSPGRPGPPLAPSPSRARGGEPGARAPARGSGSAARRPRSRGAPGSAPGSAGRPGVRVGSEPGSRPAGRGLPPGPGRGRGVGRRGRGRAGSGMGG